MSGNVCRVLSPEPGMQWRVVHHLVMATVIGSNERFPFCSLMRRKPVYTHWSVNHAEGFLKQLCMYTDFFFFWSYTLKTELWTFDLVYFFKISCLFHMCIWCIAVTLTPADPSLPAQPPLPTAFSFVCASSCMFSPSARSPFCCIFQDGFTNVAQVGL